MKKERLKIFSAATKQNRKAKLFAVSLAVVLPFLTSCAGQEIAQPEIKPNEVASLITEDYINKEIIHIIVFRNPQTVLMMYTENGIIYNGESYNVLYKYDANKRYFFDEIYGYEEFQDINATIVKEQVYNPKATILYVDGHGIARYYQNFELIQMVDLKGNVALNIDNEPKYLVSDADNLANDFIVVDGFVK